MTDQNGLIGTDDSRWPLVCFVYPSELVGDVDRFVDDFEAKLRLIHERNPGPYLSLADVRQTGWSVGAEARKKLAEMLNRVARECSRPVADAVIVDSKLMQLLTTGITFLQGNSRWPRSVFTDLDAAQDWLSQQANDAGLSFAPVTEADLRPGALKEG